MLPNERPLDQLDPASALHQELRSSIESLKMVQFTFKKQSSAGSPAHGRNQRFSVFQKRRQFRQTLTAQSLNLLRQTRRSTVLFTPSSSNANSDSNGDGEKREKAFSFVGSPYYMAPEIIRKQGYDHLVDWWSVGCMAFEMVLGFPPFMGDTPQDVFSSILDHEEQLGIMFPSDEELLAECEPGEDPLPPIGADFRSFVERLLQEPEKRLGVAGADEIRLHPFLSGTDWAGLRTVPAPFQPVLDSETDTGYFGIDVAQHAAIMAADAVAIKEEQAKFAAMETHASPHVAAKAQHAVVDRAASPKRHSRDNSGDFVGFTYKPEDFQQSKR
jgi:serine/threonine protein kinase